MGCATSAEKGVRRRKCPFSPVRRSSATHVHHVASLTSSATVKAHLVPDVENLNFDVTGKTRDRIVPRTPIRTPPGEPETINAWELMEGLEDDDPGPASPGIRRSFSYNLPMPPDIPPAGAGKIPASPPKAGSKFGVSVFSPETPDIPGAVKIPKSLRNAGLKFGASGFSQENSPPATETPEIPGAGKKPARTREAGSKFGVLPENSPPELAAVVVVYFTSLRGVRKTYEDCRDVRRIIRSIGVRIDERDVSMDSGFRDELRELLGGEKTGAGALPGVFVGKKYVGGAEEIRRLHEDGGLERVFDRCERAGGGVCGGCGDVRFVPCEDCSGSCKIYCDGGEAEEECGFQRCRRCNENGLVRCPLCCCY